MEVRINVEKLIRKRYAAGLGCKELADKAGISKISVYNIENELVQPTPGVLSKVCEALGITTDDVLEIVKSA